MQWMVLFNDLDARQRQVVTTVSRNSHQMHWVLGWAGTGKTLVVTNALISIATKNRAAKICFVTYTHSLKDLVESGLEKPVLARVTIRTIDTFKNETEKYDYIVVDEVQDIKEDLIKLLKGRAKYLIVAGDPEQSIFPKAASPEKLEALLSTAERHELTEIHRFPPSIFKLAKIVHPNNKTQRGNKTNEPDFKIRKMRFNSYQEECVSVMSEASRSSEEEIPSAILFPTHLKLQNFAKEISQKNGWGAVPEVTEKNGHLPNYDEFNQHFLKRKSPIQFLGSDNGSLKESDDRKIVYLLTYYSAKGLDFSTVFIPGLNHDFNVGGLPATHNSDWYKLKLSRLLFVAVTRARERLYLSSYGDPFGVIKSLPKEICENYSPK